MIRILVVAGIVCAACPCAQAADAPTMRTSRQQLFSPTSPDAVASDDPRSPLADVIANGDVRFASGARAQVRCPTDIVVFVEFGSNHYRPAVSPSTDGWPGAFMCQADASAEGDRP